MKKIEELKDFLLKESTKLIDVDYVDGDKEAYLLNGQCLAIEGSKICLSVKTQKNDAELVVLEIIEKLNEFGFNNIRESYTLNGIINNFKISF